MYMNLQLAQQIEALGPGSPEAEGLIREGRLPADSLYANDSKGLLGRIATDIRNLANGHEQRDNGWEALYTRTLSFAGTSLHVALTALYQKGHVSHAYTVVKEASAAWTSDQFPEDKPLVVESVCDNSVLRRGSGIVIDDAPRLRESIAETQKYLQLAHTL
jgi:hypothetical protein